MVSGEEGMEEEEENRWLDARMEECVWPSHDDDDACLGVHGGTRSADVGSSHR